MLNMQNIDKVLICKHCKEGESVAIQFLTQSLIQFFLKKQKIVKHNKNPKNMFLTSFRHLQRFSPLRSVVNVLFKSILKLLFFFKNQNTKNKKNQNILGTKYEKKEVEGSIYLLDCLDTKFA